MLLLKEKESTPLENDGVSRLRDDCDLNHLNQGPHGLLPVHRERISLFVVSSWLCLVEKTNEFGRQTHRIFAAIACKSSLAAGSVV